MPISAGRGSYSCAPRGLGILVLLVVTALSVFKPWGLTRYGRRKQQERRYQPERSAGLHRGVKIFVAVGIGVFVLAVLVSMHLTGHGPHHGH